MIEKHRDAVIDLRLRRRRNRRRRHLGPAPPDDLFPVHSDEFVKHKMLDAIGDLYMASKPLLAHYVAYKSGHALNNKLMRALLADAGHNLSDVLGLSEGQIAALVEAGVIAEKLH